MHTFSSQTDDIERVRGEVMKGVARLCYRMRSYGIRARSYSGYIRIQHHQKKGISFRFNTDGYTNLDGYVHHECMRKALPYIKNLLDAGYSLRGVGLGTGKCDLSNQQELFFAEDPQQRQYCLVKDAINNKYGNKSIVNASMMDAVPGKTHFMDR